MICQITCKMLLRSMIHNKMMGQNFLKRQYMCTFDINKHNCIIKLLTYSAGSGVGHRAVLPTRPVACPVSIQGTPPLTSCSLTLNSGIPCLHEETPLLTSQPHSELRNSHKNKRRGNSRCDTRNLAMF